jgi:hypothetical protein
MKARRGPAGILSLSVCAAMLAAGCTVSGSHAAAVARPPVVPGLDSSGPGLTGAQLPAAVVPNVSGPVSRPDLRLTPGAIATSDTAAVCLQSRRLRSPEIPPASQAAVYLEYGDTTTARQHGYRIDYLVPLDLGGAPVTANLWPAAIHGVGFYQKNQLDHIMHELVCQRSLTLGQAQRQIQQNWYATWLKYVVAAGRG